MILPNPHTAVISQSKVVNYLLDALHPDGASKARFFTALGFDRDDWQRLAFALRCLAETAEVAHSVVSAHGIKYIIDGALETPAGIFPNVRTVWIVDHGSDVPRLVTAYPHDKGDRT